MVINGRKIRINFDLRLWIYLILDQVALLHIIIHIVQLHHAPGKASKIDL